jgi:UDP-2,4-diacetamido-2,4,6-trideoxy-beta-L-altropyranose hydrolase
MWPSTNTLIVRADASAQIGTGHLMRCLALAQAWQDRGGQAILIMACESDTLQRRLVDEGFQVTILERSYPDPDDWEHTSRVLAMHPGAWVVLDGYHFDSDYQLQVKEAGHRLLVIDDMAHLDHYCADIVLNQNLHAEDLRYSCESYTRLLLGTKYVLLRREFLRWRGWKREIPEVARKVLITLGGGDPDNVTLRVIQALQQMEVDELEAMVVVGGSNPHYEQLQSTVRNSRLSIRLESNVTNMPDLMAWADVAVSAGGSTSWELAFMGLPSLTLILADNQWPVAERLNMDGMAVNLGWYGNLPSAEIAQTVTRLLAAGGIRAQMARRGRELVDGEGVRRVLDSLASRILRLRRASEDDCRLVWEWAKDPDVRAVSFSSEPIPWEQHIQWFKSKIDDPHCIFYIAVNSDDMPIGQARYDREGNQAIVSISIDRRFRGKGYGSRLIWLASREAFDVSGTDTIHAYVKQGNEASVRAFVKAGFKNRATTTIRGYEAIHLVLRKDDLVP